MRHKSKRLLKIFLIVLFSIQACLLLYLTVQYSIGFFQTNQKQPINTEYRESMTDALEYHYFAQPNGSVYYTIDCNNNQVFDMESAIWFISEQEAQGRGLRKSKKC